MTGHSLTAVLRNSLLVALLLMAAGCRPARISSTQLGAVHSPRPAGSAVAVYSVGIPQCDFEEIAMVTLERDNPFLTIGRSTPEEQLEVLKAAVSDRGGDAIVGLTPLAATENFRGGWRGIAVKLSPECPE